MSIESELRQWSDRVGDDLSRYGKHEMSEAISAGADEIERLRAKIERLRAALTDIGIRVQRMDVTGDDSIRVDEIIHIIAQTNN